MNSRLDLRFAANYERRNSLTDMQPPCTLCPWCFIVPDGRGHHHRRLYRTIRSASENNLPTCDSPPSRRLPPPPWAQNDEGRPRKVSSSIRSRQRDAAHSFASASVLPSSLSEYARYARHRVHLSALHSATAAAWHWQQPWIGPGRQARVGDVLTMKRSIFINISCPPPHPPQGYS